MYSTLFFMPTELMADVFLLVLNSVFKCCRILEEGLVPRFAFPAVCPQMLAAGDKVLGLTNRFTYLN